VHQNSRYMVRAIFAALHIGAAQIALAVCVNPGKLPVDIRDCGAHPAEEAGYANFDSTAAITAALNAGNVIRIPPGTWRVTQISIPTGKTVATAGLKTTFQQIRDTGLPIVVIAGSNVKLGSFSATGNIATDQSEHNHALLVGSTSPISNVHIGDVMGSDIRGDVLYVGGTAAAPVSNVHFGTIKGRNILRSIVSITGGVDISGIAIIGGNCGYTTLDIEPNPGSQAPDRIAIAKVQGGKVQLASGSPEIVVGSVEIGSLDLSTDYQSPPNPAYTRADGTSYFDTDIAILASSWSVLKIGNFHATRKGWSAFYSAAWNLRRGGSVEIGNYIGSDNGTRNQTHGEFHCGGCSKLKIDSGTTRPYSPHMPLFTGAATTVYAIRNFRMQRGM
jgi:hypothetical protein